MKKIIFALVCIAIAFTCTAQIKIHNDNHVSIGSLSKSGGIQMQPSGYVYFQPALPNDYAWMQLSHSPNLLSKNYIVYCQGNHRFFVYGNGNTVGTKYWEMVHYEEWETITSITNPLLQVTGLNGVSYSDLSDTPGEDDTNNSKNRMTENNQRFKEGVENNEYIAPDTKDILIKERTRRHIGLIAEEVEKVVPEAVRTMPDGTKAISYSDIVTLCVEALKELNSKIEKLERIISEIKPKKEDEPYQKIPEQINEQPKKAKKIKEDVRSGDIQNAALYQNYPNPFNKETIIQSYIPDYAIQAFLCIYDLQGKQVMNIRIEEKGRASTPISANRLSPGMYIYTLLVDNQLIDKKQMIITD